VLPREGAILAWYARQGIEVQVMPFVEMHRRRSLVYLVRYLVSTVSVILRLARLVRERDVEVVHVNELTYWPGLVAGRLAGARTVCHARVILERPGWLRRFLGWVAERFADRVLCVSDAVRGRMFPGAGGGVQTLYNPGPDLDRFDAGAAGDGVAVRRELGIAAEAFVVGLVSKFVPSKGHLVLVEAGRLIRERYGELTVSYVLVGGEVPGHEAYYAEVRARIERYGLQDTFVLTGAREDVPGLVLACDVMVHLPLHEDPFPGVVLEAMAMEKPIVGSRSGGIPEQFEDGRCGVLVGKDDSGAVAEVLARLAGDRELREAMGREARRFLASHFSFDRFFSELGAIYAGLVQRATVD
jgi:glycosyltransferase involved in cell wall biosynthesis